MGEQGYQESPTEAKDKKIQAMLSGRGNKYVYSWRTMQQCNVLLKKKKSSHLIPQKTASQRWWAAP